MDYSQLSDAEIAQKVWFWWNSNIIHDNTICCMSGGKMLYQKNEVWVAFDPCNSVTDAWPIIESERISLLADYEKWGETTAACETDRGGDYIYEYCDKKAFRAAMIVFLQMQAEKHA
mgnify:CR=1 FL=1